MGPGWGGATPSQHLSVQITPSSVHLLNQLDLPIPVPLLHLLLPSYRTLHRRMRLIPHQTVNSILLRKPSNQPVLVLPHSPRDVRRHADVEYPVLLAGEHVHARDHTGISRRGDHLTRFSLPLRPSPTPRCHTTPSYRTPIRYPPLPRRTAPRSGTHPLTSSGFVAEGVPTRALPWIPHRGAVRRGRGGYRVGVRYDGWGVGTGSECDMTVGGWVPDRGAVRYPPLPRLTAPRCGIHGRARVGTPSATNPLDVRAVPTAVTPLPPSFRPPSRNPQTVVPHPDAVPTPPSSYRTPIRYPPPNRHIALRSGTHPPTVISHPDPVPTPPSSYRTPMRYPW